MKCGLNFSCSPTNMDYHYGVRYYPFSIMKDFSLAIVARADERGEVLSLKSIDSINEFYNSHLYRFFCVNQIAANVSSIKRNAARHLFEKRPDLVAPGGNSYTSRRCAACLRDLEIILRYLSYALFLGDASILKDRCLNGLHETYTTLGVPTDGAALGIQQISREVINLFNSVDIEGEDWQEWIINLPEDMIPTASQIRAFKNTLISEWNGYIELAIRSILGTGENFDNFVKSNLEASLQNEPDVIETPSTEAEMVMDNKDSIDKYLVEFYEVYQRLDKEKELFEVTTKFVPSVLHEALINQEKIHFYYDPRFYSKEDAELKLSKAINTLKREGYSLGSYSPVFIQGDIALQNGQRDENGGIVIHVKGSLCGVI